MRIKAYSYKYTTNFPQSINSLKWSKRNETPAEKMKFRRSFFEYVFNRSFPLMPLHSMRFPPFKKLG